MIFQVTHKIEYYYDQAVFLEPHIVNLIPHPVQEQKLISYKYLAEPNPSGVTFNNNMSGFTNQLIWFENTIKYFSIEATSVIKLKEFNPFLFFIHPLSGVDLPLSYSKEEISLLWSYSQPMCKEPAVKLKAQELSKKAGFHAVSFLTQTCQWIHKEFGYEIREKGEPFNAAKTLLEMKGSCRDLTVLFMDLCRYMGFASRFVSGYYIDEKERLELHAWADVFIPGAGWRGFDPTHGIACFGKHIALTAAHDPLLCAPVIGSFRGQGEAVMKTNLSLSPHQID